MVISFAKPSLVTFIKSVNQSSINPCPVISNLKLNFEASKSLDEVNFE